MQELKTTLCLLVVIRVLLWFLVSARRLLNIGDTQFCEITHESPIFTYISDRIFVVTYPVDRFTLQFLCYFIYSCFQKQE